MVHEIETKVLDVDRDDILQKLSSMGAKVIRDTRLTVDWYRPVGTKEGEDEWFLRIRSSSEGIHEVTWKAKSEILGTARKHKEINFDIKSPEELSDLFQELGLEKYAHQEKDRLSLSYKDWLFEMDDYPKMPPFLEIEGNSEGHVNKAIGMLGLKDNRTWADGERTLIQEIYKLNWYQMKF